MKYEVTIRVVVEADSPEDAYELGVSAAEHLSDTFNDDESLTPFMGVDVNPNPNPNPVEHP